MGTNRLKNMKTIIKTNSYTIENLNPQIGSFEAKDLGSNKFILDFGRKVKGDLTTITLIYTPINKDYEIRTTGASCGCTKPTFVNTDDGSQQVTIEYDSNKIANNISKAVTLYLVNSTQIKINLIMNKL